MDIVVLKEKYKVLGIKFIVFVLLSTMALVVCMLSPVDFLTPKGVPYTDSSVFEYMGRLMEAGGLPYRDAFDHKGILLYLINFWGVKIAPHRGIWIIGCPFMLATTMGIYKVARLFAGRIPSLLTVMVVMGTMTVYFEGGNFTEGYALPMQIWSLYIYLDYLLNNKISTIRVIISGFLFGCVCFIRINMIPVWLTFSVYIFFRCIAKKDFKSLIRFVASFLIGFFIIAGPMLVYLTSNHILSEFIADYWTFNRLYSSDPKRAGAMQKIRAILFFIDTETVWLSFAFLTFAIIRDKGQKRNFNILYLVYMVITILLICMSGQTYGHYGMGLQPILIYPYAYFWGQISKQDIIKITGKSLAAAYIIVALIAPNWSSMLNSFSLDITNYMINGDNIQNQDYSNMIKYISENTAEDDLISSYGNEVSIYVMSGRFSASKYIYQTRADIIPSILDEYYEELDDNNVRLIIMTSAPNERMRTFLTNHSMTNTQTFGGYQIYE